MIRWFNNFRIRTKIILCALTILVLVGIMAGVVYGGIVESQDRDQLVVRSDDIVRSTDTLLVHLTNMEMAYRSYLLTGDKAYLQRYDESYQAYTQEQAHIQALIRDDAAHVEQLRLIDLEVQAWRIYVHQTGIRTRNRLGRKPSAATDAFIATGYRGKQDFDDIQNRLNVIRAVEVQGGEARRQEAQTAARRLRATLLVGTLLASALSLGALSFLASNIARRVERVTWAATQIAGGDTTVRCDLPASRDEVGLMGATFNTMAQIIQQRTDDLTSQYTTAEAARHEAETAREQIAEQLALIDEQQAVIRDMSVPVLPLLASTLVMPLVGPLDSERLALMQAQALQELERSHARQLILDITGVPIVDTQVALGLTRLVQAARLLGAKVSIVGVRPEVAQAIVGLGVDLSHISTHSTLQVGILQALAEHSRTEPLDAYAKIHNGSPSHPN